ncbi:MAG: pyridoxamine 5'-phosphate oxidase family protein [Bacteroidales bacterium]|jgi:hypothetical protein
MRRKERKITDIKIIESILVSADVCRVAFADNNVPYIVTMNYGYTTGKNNILYFHSAPEGRKIELIGKNNFVCFQIDTDHILYKGSKACAWGMKYKSIVGYGLLSIADTEAERRRALDLIMNHYGAKGMLDYDAKELARTTILRLDISEMTGKQA